MALNPLTILDLEFPEAAYPEILLYDWGNAGKTYGVKTLTKHGIDWHVYATSSDRSMTERSFRLSDLPLMVAVEAGEADVRRGEVYVLCNLRFSGVEDFPLFCGYVSHARRMSWPPGVFEPMFSGHGLMRSITGTNPAAGAEISETVPTNAVWRLWGLTIPLTTDATVANRRVTLRLDDGTNDFHRYLAHAAQAASLLRTYCAYPIGYATVDIGQDTPILLASPPPFLFQGWRIRTSTISLQAGDDYGAPQLFVEEWIQE